MEKLKKILASIPIWLLSKLSNRQYLILAAILIGLWAGLTAVLLKISVHFLQQVIKSVSYQYSWLYIVSPAIGILLTILFIKWILKEQFLKGTSFVLLAIAKKSSFIPRSETFSHIITSGLTVGMGGSAGLESPIVQTGSAIGSTFASFFPISYRDRTLLLACGAAAGIATAFDAPIAGVLFALEVLLVDVSVNAFIPLLMAGATGALCSKIILAEDILLSFKKTTQFNYHNVFYYLVLGITCGLMSVYYVKVYSKIDSLFFAKINSKTGRFLVGSSLLGILIFLFPSLFGEGYSFVRVLAVVSPQQFFDGSPLQNLLLLTNWGLGLGIFFIALLKVVAVSLTLNAGGNGGNFAPSLFIGACLGFSFSYLLNSFGLTDLPTSNFCLVAMAGVLAGIFRAPLMAIFLIAEITGGYELIIPLMIVAALSIAVSRYLSPNSLDEIKLKLLDNTISFDKDTYVLSELSLQGIIENDFVKVHEKENLKALVEAVAHSKRNIFPVLNEHEKLVGIISLEDIREIMFNVSLYETIKINSLMQRPKVSAELSEDMSSIMEKFDKSGVWNIPVTSGGIYKGFISKSSVLTLYRQRLKRE